MPRNRACKPHQNEGVFATDHSLCVSIGVVDGLDQAFACSSDIVEAMNDSLDASCGAIGVLTGAVEVLCGPREASADAVATMEPFASPATGEVATAGALRGAMAVAIEALGRVADRARMGASRPAARRIVLRLGVELLAAGVVATTRAAIAFARSVHPFAWRVEMMTRAEIALPRRVQAFAR